jgi:hypothetical protein
MHQKIEAVDRLWTGAVDTSKPLVYWLFGLLVHSVHTNFI